MVVRSIKQKKIKKNSVKPIGVRQEDQCLKTKVECQMVTPIRERDNRLMRKNKLI